MRLGGDSLAAGDDARGPLLAAAVAFVVYLPSLGGGFLYDDQHVIVDNRSIRDLRALSTVLLSEPSRPLLSLTWALNYAVAGLRPWPYHLVNVIVHAGNAALLASLFTWMALRSGRPHPRASALIGACLFATAPMAAETVAYVSSRSTALATLLGLASLRLAVDTLAGAARGRLVPAVVLFALALATKEEAASIPLLLLLLDYFFVAGKSLRGVARHHRVHLPFLLLPVLGLVARRAVTGAWLPPPAMEHGRYLATQLAVFPLYLLRAIFPVDPAFYRAHPAAVWPPHASTLAGVFLTAVLFAVALRFRRSWSEASLAILWLAAGLIPSSSLVPLKEVIVDHRAYLGSAGVAYAAGGLLSRPGRAAPVIGLLAVLAARSFHYQRVLADPIRAWTDAVRRAPFSPEAHRALGEAYAARSDARAEGALRRAVALDPADFRSWVNLGAFYAGAGRMEEAEEAMRGAARLAPADGRVRNNLGLVLLALGREDEAVLELEAAVAADRELAQPRIDLASLLLRRGHPARARDLIDEASRLVIDPEDAAAILSLRQRLPPS